MPRTPARRLPFNRPQLPYGWNQAPEAANITITGNTPVGSLLTSHYLYNDAEGDAEATPAYRWLRDGVPIGGATAATYTTVAGDLNKTVTVEITPKAATGTTPGRAYVSLSGVLVTA